MLILLHLFPRATADPDAPDVNEWRRVNLGTSFGGDDLFRTNGSGVQAAAGLTADSSTLDAFQCLFDIAAVDFLVKSINDYAAMKIVMNSPMSKAYRLANWTSVDRTEIIKLLCILIQYTNRHGC